MSWSTIIDLVLDDGKPWPWPAWPCPSEEAGLLTELRLGDFEGWEGEQVVRLAPLTLFFGRNGSGKSALIHAVCDRATDPKRRMVRGRLRRGDLELEEILGQWLRALGIVEDFSVVESLDDASLHGVRVRVKGNEVHIPVTHAGSGAPHALLVLVRAFSRTTRAPVHLEYPESHLQPSAQSALADALLEAMRTRGTQLLVETHSERLLRRVQRRIAEGLVSKDEVAVYLVDSCDGKPEIQELAIGEYGDIANWPADFFGDETSDLLAMAKAAAERRQQP
jgi:predicted ATPase